MKKEYSQPNIKELKIILEDIILVSYGGDRDLFDFDDEL